MMVARRIMRDRCRTWVLDRQPSAWGGSPGGREACGLVGRRRPDNDYVASKTRRARAR